MSRLRERAEQLAAEQGSLRRVATAVVGGDRPSGSTSWSRGVGAAARCRRRGILRLDSEDAAIVMGSWADHEGGRYEPGTVDRDRPRRRRRPRARDRRAGPDRRHAADSPVGRLGYDSSIVAPIRVGGDDVGGAGGRRRGPTRLTAETSSGCIEFGDLLATAIASIEDRAKLAAQAATDPLTGLANHRTLQQRLGGEVAAADPPRTPLSVAVHRHRPLQADQRQRRSRRRRRDARSRRAVSGELARAEDTLGRVGGDEFAWILPETTREQALVAVERARRLIASAAPDPVPDHRLGRDLRHAPSRSTRPS